MIKNSINSDQKFINKLMRQPLISKQEEKKLISLWHSKKDERSLHKIIISHGRLVVSLANKFRNYGLPLSELIQEGNIGLMQAADRFSLDRDVRFSTYASWWIKASMQSYILNNWSIVKIGTTATQKSLFFKLRSMMLKISKGKDGVFDINMQIKLAKEIGVKFKDIETMKGRVSSPDQSLNALMSDESNTEMQDLLIDERPTPESTAIKIRDREIITEQLKIALDQLPVREKKIINARQFSENTLTLQELGKDLGISKERVRQLEGRALIKLKNSIKKNFTKSYDLLSV